MLSQQARLMLPFHLATLHLCVSNQAPCKISLRATCGKTIKGEELFLQASAQGEPLIPLCPLQLSERSGVTSQSRDGPADRDPTLLLCFSTGKGDPFAAEIAKIMQLGKSE